MDRNKLQNDFIELEKELNIKYGYHMLGIALGGSHSLGLANETSDIDCYCVVKDDLLEVQTLKGVNCHYYQVDIMIIGISMIRESLMISQNQQYPSCLFRNSIEEKEAVGRKDIESTDFVRFAFARYLLSPIRYEVEENQDIMQLEQQLSVIEIMDMFYTRAYGNWRNYISNKRQVQVRKYLYTLQELLFCQWILKYNTVPPSEFCDLLLDEDITDEIKNQVISLVEKNRTTRLKKANFVIEPQQQLNNLIENLLDKMATEMKQLFTVTKQSEIILYGAAAIGNIVYEKLTNAGFHVVGYIDKRAGEIDAFNQLPVWNIDTVPEQYDRKNVIVFVAVKNVFDHDSIAFNLIEQRFENLIYKSHNVLCGVSNAWEQKMAEYYDIVVEGEPKRNITITKTFQLRQPIKDSGLIRESGNQVTAYIPFEFIYTNNYKNSPMEKWGNINIAAFFTHINFWGFLSNSETGNYQDYLEEYCVFTANIAGKITTTQAWKDNVLDNRKQIFEQMKLQLQMNYKFFIENAPTARWNEERGYFNLTSGKHRATFLLSQGYYYLPLTISKKDYETYINRQIVRELLSEETQLSMRDVSLIPHPYFYEVQGNVDNGMQKLISSCSLILAKMLYNKYHIVDFSKACVLDEVEEVTELTRHFKRMGCHVHRTYQSDTYDTKLCHLLHVQPWDVITESTDFCIRITNEKEYMKSDAIDNQEIVVLLQGHTQLFTKIENLKVQYEFFDGTIGENQTSNYILFNDRNVEMVNK